MLRSSNIKRTDSRITFDKKNSKFSVRKYVKNEAKLPVSNAKFKFLKKCIVPDSMKNFRHIK